MPILINARKWNWKISKMSVMQCEDKEMKEQDNDDNLGDEVNIVVKKSYWLCKDCNIKRTFGCGESIEEHVFNAHSINNKIKFSEEPNQRGFGGNNGCGFVTSYPSVNLSQGEVVASQSDSLAAVLSIPNSSFAVDASMINTLILIDDTTKMELVTTEAAQNGQFGLPALADSSGTIERSDFHVQQITNENLSKFAHLSKDESISQIRPIPVLMALAAASELCQNYTVTQAESICLDDGEELQTVSISEKCCDPLNNLGKDALFIDSVNVVASIPNRTCENNSNYVPSKAETVGSLQDCTVNLERLSPASVNFLTYKNKNTPLSTEVFVDRNHEQKSCAGSLHYEVKSKTTNLNIKKSKGNISVLKRHHQLFSEAVEKSSVPMQEPALKKSKTSSLEPSKSGRLVKCTSFKHKIRKPVRFHEMKMGAMGVEKTLLTTVEQKTASVARPGICKNTNELKQSSLAVFSPKKLMPDQLHLICRKSSSGRIIKKPVRFLEKLTAVREKQILRHNEHGFSDDLTVHLSNTEINVPLPATFQPCTCNLAKQSSCNENQNHKLAQNQMEKIESVCSMIIEESDRYPKASDSSFSSKTSTEKVSSVTTDQSLSGTLSKHFLSCKNCGRKFSCKLKLRKHKEQYQGEIMQQCLVCNIQMHGLDLLNVHMYHVHKTKEPTKCLTCSIVCGSKRKLLYHLLTHPTAKGQTLRNLIQDSCKTHMCTVCHEPIVIGEGRVEKHYAVHKSLEAHFCPVCNKTFSRKGRLYCHLAQHGHLAAESSEPRCNELGDGSDSLQAVKKRLLSSETSVNRSDAQLPLHELDPLAFHGKSMDENICRPSVQFYSDVFPIQEESEEITDSHDKTTDNKPNEKPLQVYTCTDCGEKFRLKKLLYLHLKDHVEFTLNSSVEGQQQCFAPIDLSNGVPSNIPCTIIKIDSKQLSRYMDVLSSLKTPSENRSDVTKPWLCNLCDKEFESTKKLWNHIRRQSNQLIMLQCRQCSCKFHSIDTFNVHFVFAHTFDAPALCFTCMTEFKNKSDFITHLGNSPIVHPESVKLGLKTFLLEACGKVACTVCHKAMWNYPAYITTHSKQHDMDSFRCLLCTLAFKYKYAWLIHMQVHTDSQKQLAPVTELFNQEPEMSEKAELVEKIHRTVMDMEDPAFEEKAARVFPCPVCDMEIFQQRKNIHNHLDFHTRKLLRTIVNEQYICPDCGKYIMASKQGIADHMAVHGHESFMLLCYFCKETFETFEDYAQHQTEQHWLNNKVGKSYVCEICGKEKGSSAALQKHVNLHGEKQGHYKCHRCRQTFRFESKLLLHLEKHDSGQSSYACQYCGKLYMTKISLQRHEQVDHIGIKDLKFKCRYCEAQFIGSTLRRNHENAIHKNKDNYLCDDCGMGFKYQSTYDRHKRTKHNGDTPYVCKECGEKFSMKKYLLLHSVSHSGYNPLACPECAKMFSSARAVQDHCNFFHRDIFNYNCDRCGKKFPRRSNLRRHIREQCCYGIDNSQQQSAEDSQIVSILEVTDLARVDNFHVYTVTAVAGGVPVIEATCIS